MKWADYRERLNLGFDDKSKFETLKNRFSNFGSNLDYRLYSHNDCCEYFIAIGKPWDTTYDSSYQVSKSFQECTSLKEVVLNAVALYNSYIPTTYDRERMSYKEIIWDFIEKSLEELNIPYELISDKDGFFIFPKGVPEFDDNLVSAPLSWFKEYPKAEKAWSRALRDYSEKKDDPSQVADGFRKALESFFQEIYGFDKSLENLLSVYGSFLKDHGIPSEISDDFRKLLDAYTHFNNNYAKHHDKATLNVLEYIMYATGNIMRLVIILKNSEASAS